MNHITAVFVKEASSLDKVSDVALQMDALQRASLDHTPWPAFPYKPEVHVAVAHGNDCMFLKYYVTEDQMMAANGGINGRVWEDSCVEFFISFGDEKEYYNFEVNCIGTCLVGFGAGKTGRELLPAGVISNIRYQVAVTNGRVAGSKYWELTLLIPGSVFSRHAFTSFRGCLGRVNFYKCGDLLPKPHFVTWSDIDAPAPDFHLPEFFGTLHFE